MNNMKLIAMQCVIAVAVIFSAVSGEVHANNVLIQGDGVNARYYYGTSWDPGQLAFSRIDPVISADYNYWPTYNGVRIFGYSGDNTSVPYCADFAGYLKIPADGTYMFGAITDDYGGMTMQVGNTLVDLSPWHSSWMINAHLSTDHHGGYDLYDSETVFLQAGFYPVFGKFAEYDALVGAQLSFYWMLPGATSWELVPQNMLFTRIPAGVRIEPETVNLESEGVFTAFITLPKGYDVADIDLSTVVCEGAHAVRGNVAGEKLIVKFNRCDLIGVLAGGNIVFTVTGHFVDGTPFGGVDTVRVKAPR